MILWLAKVVLQLTDLQIWSTELSIESGDKLNRINEFEDEKAKISMDFDDFLKKRSSVF